MESSGREGEGEGEARDWGMCHMVGTEGRAMEEGARRGERQARCLPRPL